MPNLRNYTIQFHTSDEDKDDDTHVTITVRDSNQVIAARIDSDFGHFDDQSNNGPFGLLVKNQSGKDILQTGNVTVRIDPNGHDTWRFNFFLDLIFDDGSHLSGVAEGLSLNQDHKEASFGLQGILRQAA